MKLALRQVDSIAVLEVSGEVDPHNFQVLKAGIVKLLQAGKNRIILSFPDAEEIESDVLRELAIIDVTARELSGKIVLAAANEDFRESVKIFAKPPVIPILSSVDLALDYFKKTEPTAEEEDNPLELKALLKTKDTQIEALEARLKAIDPQEALKTNALNAELRLKLSILEEQVDELLREKRIPVDAEAFLEKVDALESSVKRLSVVEKQ